MSHLHNIYQNLIGSVKKSENPGAIILFKILALEEANKDEILRQEHRDRNNILIEHYREKLRDYEIRN